MASWSELQDEVNRLDPGLRGAWLHSNLKRSAEKIADISKRNVLYYASSFLQKPQVPGHYVSLNPEDLNGFMAGMHGLDFDRDLLLILHTPGGLAEAAQTIMDYLRSKFTRIDVVIPTYAMSAGTMIALGCDSIIMGRQSQLGPTDPQLVVGYQAYSAHAIISQFDEAKADIQRDPQSAAAWAPVLRSYGPALLQHARNAISFGQDLVERWLERHMFRDEDDPKAMAQQTAEHFGGGSHASHGRRIDRTEAASRGIKIVALEENQDLQEAVLTLYHLSTIAFESTPAVKSVTNSIGRFWIKNFTERAS